MIYCEEPHEKKEIESFTIDNIQLNSETWYSGLNLGRKLSENIDEKSVRRILGLPVTKQLVYYKNHRDEKSKVKILKYRLLEYYKITESWTKIEVLTEEDKSVKIHSDFLIHMQKPSFIKDMKEMELNLMDEEPEEELQGER